MEPYKEDDQEWNPKEDTQEWNPVKRIRKNETL